MLVTEKYINQEIRFGTDNITSVNYKSNDKTKEINTIVRDIRGNCHLPATKDLFYQLKKGDKVVIRSDAYKRKYWQNGFVTPYMKKFLGKEITISYKANNPEKICHKESIFNWQRKTIDHISFIS